MRPAGKCSRPLANSSSSRLGRGLYGFRGTRILSFFLPLLAPSSRDIFGAWRKGKREIRGGCLARERNFLFFQRNSARCTRFDSAAWSYSFILSALLRRITKRNVRFFGGTTPAARHPLSVVRGIFASVKLLPESISLFVSSRACRV